MDRPSNHFYFTATCIIFAISCAISTAPCAILIGPYAISAVLSVIFTTSSIFIGLLGPKPQAHTYTYVSVEIIRYLCLLVCVECAILKISISVGGGANQKTSFSLFSLSLLLPYSFVAVVTLIFCLFPNRVTILTSSSSSQGILFMVPPPLFFLPEL